MEESTQTNQQTKIREKRRNSYAVSLLLSSVSFSLWLRMLWYDNIRMLNVAQLTVTQKYKHSSYICVFLSVLIHLLCKSLKLMSCNLHALIPALLQTLISWPETRLRKLHPHPQPQLHPSPSTSPSASFTLNSGVPQGCTLSPQIHFLHQGLNLQKPVVEVS